MNRELPMQIKPLEVYSEETNLAVIKPPGRKFPGSVIQGDSLRELCNLATSVAKRIQELHPTNEELQSEVKELANQLVARILHYQDVMTKHGIELPYAIPMTTNGPLP
jgi:hypothetical protein